MEQQLYSGSFEERRRAEIEAGRARVEERAASAGTPDKELRRLMKASDDQLKEDEDRRRELLTAEPDRTRIDRDRAGAEIADQAQTELEALGHGANNRETIILAPHQQSVEAMEHPTADPKEATAVTTDVVTAQAVNSPTVLASEDGFDTEKLPLAPGLEEGTASPMVQLPKDKHVPKTRRQAEKVAKGKVPPAEQVVKRGWHQPERGENADVAVKAVDAVDDDILGPA